MEEVPLPTAYCAPGHLLRAERVLDEAGEWVKEICEHLYLIGQDGVLLVAPAEEIPVPEWSTVLPHCGICDGVLPYHGPFCLVRATVPAASLTSLLSGF